MFELLVTQLNIAKQLSTDSVNFIKHVYGDKEIKAMKRLLISLATASFATSALAAFPVNTNPAGSWVIGATGAFLQAASSNGDFDYAASNIIFASSRDGFIYNLDSDYHWAWGVHGSYFTPNGVNDITLRYFHARNGEDDNDTVSFVDGVGPLGTPNGVTNGDRLWGSESTKLDQIDLVGGQYIPIRSCLTLHPFAGLRWAEIRRTLDSTNYDTPDGQFTLFHQHSKFIGIGPNVGMDANYFLTPNFSLVASLGTSLLVGDVKPHVAIFADGFNVPGNTDFHHVTPKNKSHRIVPALDIKLGADYTYIFDSSTLSNLSVELGWKFTEYFNSMDSINILTANAQGIGATRSSSGDLSLQGPYAELSVAF